MADSELKQGDESLSKQSSIFSKIRNYFSGEKGLENPSRRAFLRGAAATAATLALGSSVSPGEQAAPAVPTPEAPTEVASTEVEAAAEQEKGPVIPLILDIFNAPAFFDKVIQEQYAQNGVDVQGTLDKFGFNESWTFYDFKNVVPENDTERAILLLTSLKTHYASHGANVDAVRANTARFLNTPEIQAAHGTIEEAISLDSIETDELGNPTLWLRVSPEIVDQLLAQSDESVINMSFQLGKVGVKYKLYKEVKANPDAQYPVSRSRTVGDNVTTTYYDAENNEISQEKYDELERLASEKKVIVSENPTDRDLLIQDGYIKERAYVNLKLMAELATKHPDKILVVAAGNPTDGLPDLRDARAKLSEEGLWPPNLFTIGFVTEQQGYMVPVEHGADFYIWHKDIDLISDENQASSYATPMVTEIVRHLQSLGLTEPEDIREALLHMSTDINTPDHYTYIEGNSDQPYYMIDFGKVKRAFQAKSDTASMKAE